MIIYFRFYVQVSSTVHQSHHKFKSIWIFAVLNDIIAFLTLNTSTQKFITGIIIGQRTNAYRNSDDFKRCTCTISSLFPSMMLLLTSSDKVSFCSSLREISCIQTLTKPHLPEKTCYCKVTPVQDIFQPIPGLISSPGKINLSMLLRANLESRPSVLDFVTVFLQNCETKPGMENPGLRLTWGS